MLLSSRSFRPPTPQARRRFRIFVGSIGVAVVVLLALQYSRNPLLPERKTNTLWGFLVGILGMTTFLEIQWSRRGSGTGDRGR